MKRDWLNMRRGIDFAAIGLLAVCVGVALVVFQDIWFVATGTPPAMWLYHRLLSYLAAAVGSVFSVASFFVFRPGLPKYVAAILAISFALYVLQPLLPVHGYREVAFLCIVRTVGFCSLLLLVREYLRDLKAGKVE
jgi:ABC-type enterochelin transport system permease subunit